MKVTGTGQGSVDRARDIAGTGSAGAVDKAGGKRRTERAPEIDSGISEKVAISSKGKEALRAKDIARTSPDVDEAKVNRLRSAIENGSYKFDAEKVADKLVNEHLEAPF